MRGKDKKIKQGSNNFKTLFFYVKEFEFYSKTYKSY